jgi:hypothetical protein
VDVCTNVGIVAISSVYRLSLDCLEMDDVCWMSYEGHKEIRFGNLRRYVGIQDD